MSGWFSFQLNYFACQIPRIYGMTPSSSYWPWNLPEQNRQSGCTIGNASLDVHFDDKFSDLFNVSNENYAFAFH